MSVQKRTFKHPTSKRGPIIAAGISAVVLAAITLILALQAGKNPPTTPPAPPVVGTEIIFQNPVANATLGQGFTKGTLAWNATLGEYRAYRFQDFIADEGAPVLAVFDGRVESVTTTPMTGTTITIRINEKLVTVYRSLGEDTKVVVGQNVKEGQQIGTVGVHPDWRQDGAKLMLEVLFEGKQVDPLLYFESDEK